MSIEKASLAALSALFFVAPLSAADVSSINRIDPRTVELVWTGKPPSEIWISADQAIDDADRRVPPSGIEAVRMTGRLTLELPVTERRYVLVRGYKGAVTTLAERVLPMEQGSNFRDVGGYVTKDGRSVRWGRAFRSGAMPLLTEADYALAGQLKIATVVDLRSIEEREVAPDQLDDRTGAEFISNDYSLKPLMAGFSQANGENLYRGMEKLLAPQFRSLYRHLGSGEGAVVYHCSAGQDRTGIATALLYDMLGVDRAVILKDYHMSTALRRPAYEMPKVNPTDYPNNPLLRYYFSKDETVRAVAEPLYTKSGASHLAQFFTYIDAEYGGSEAYMRKLLGFTDADIARLRAAMLD